MYLETGIIDYSPLARIW